MAFAKRVDRNHGEIVAALRKIGWFVIDTSRLPHFVDAVAVRGARAEFVEVKGPRGKLNPAQVRLHAEFARQGIDVKILRTIEDAVRL